VRGANCRRSAPAVTTASRTGPESLLLEVALTRRALDGHNVAQIGETVRAVIERPDDPFTGVPSERPARLADVEGARELGGSPLVDESHEPANERRKTLGVRGGRHEADLYLLRGCDADCPRLREPFSFAPAVLNEQHVAKLPLESRRSPRFDAGTSRRRVD
jgi:hypothetical protein